MDSLLQRLDLVGRLGKNPKRVAAVAAYEDSHTEARVDDFCQTLGRHLGSKCEVVKQMWLFSELRITQLRAIAAGEAAQANLVIISAHHAENFPLEVQEWLRLWLDDHQRQSTLLLALFDPPYQGDSTSLQTYLKNASQRGKLDLFVHAAEVPEED